MAEIVCTKGEKERNGSPIYCWMGKKGVLKDQSTVFICLTQCYWLFGACLLATVISQITNCKNSLIWINQIRRYLKHNQFNTFDWMKRLEYWYKIVSTILNRMIYHYLELYGLVLNYPFNKLKYWFISWAKNKEKHGQKKVYISAEIKRADSLLLWGVLHFVIVYRSLNCVLGQHGAVQFDWGKW